MSFAGGAPSNKNQCKRTNAGNRKLLCAGLVLVASLVFLAAFIWHRPLSPSDQAGRQTAFRSAAEPGISIITQPVQCISGRRLEPCPAVFLADYKGRPAAAVPVTVQLTKGVFAAGSVTEVVTDAEGRAVFAALKSKEAGACRLSFSAPGYSSVQSSDFIVRFGVPRHLSVVREPRDSTSGAILPGQPAVRVTDEAGNPVPGINVDALLEAPGNGANKLATVPTDADGLAVFSNLVMPGAGDGFRLKFDARAAGVNDAISAPFNLTNS